MGSYRKRNIGKKILEKKNLPSKFLLFFFNVVTISFLDINFIKFRIVKEYLQHVIFVYVDVLAKNFVLSLMIFYIFL